MAVAILFGEQENTEQVNCVVSSMLQACPLYPPIADVSLRRSEPPLRAISGHQPRPVSLELLCQFGSLLFARSDHIDRTAIPRMFECKRHDFPNTDES
jgi:hypothetical protein